MVLRTAAGGCGGFDGGGVGDRGLLSEAGEHTVAAVLSFSGVDWAVLSWVWVYEDVLLPRAWAFGAGVSTECARASSAAVCVVRTGAAVDAVVESAAAVDAAAVGDGFAVGCGGIWGCA